jgi:hypothetical protein
MAHMTQIDRLGLAFEFSPVYTFLNHEYIFEMGEPNTNTTFLVDMIKQYNIKNIDFLACETLMYDGWKDFYRVLNEETGIIVGASNDKTGNIKYGGDWVMESTNTDVENIYFTKSIEYYTYLLDYSSINYIYTNGKIYLSGRTSYSFNSTLVQCNGGFFGKTIASVECSLGNSFFLMTDGTIYGCGLNNSSQLGVTNPSVSSSNVTVGLCQIPNPTGKTCSSIKVGEYFLIALMTDGTIYSIGHNGYGQLGDNTTTSRNAFVQMTNTTGKTPSAIACGIYHTLVLMTDGTIYGCGKNDYGTTPRRFGALGNGITTLNSNSKSLTQLINP